MTFRPIASALRPSLLLALLVAAHGAGSAPSGGSGPSAAPLPAKPSASPPSTARPPAPSWVFRGILAGDEVPAVFLALNKEMTLAYDEKGGSLLLAWKGRAVPVSGAAGGGASGPSPAGGESKRYRAEGRIYHRRIAASPWSASGPKGTFKVTPRFEGASSAGDLAALRWSFPIPGGGRAEVEEVPMFDDHYGDPGLFRNFTVKGLPKGRSLRLALAGRGLAETWGGGGDGGMSGEGDALVLVQEGDGQTPLKVTWSETPAPGDPAWDGVPR